MGVFKKNLDTIDKLLKDSPLDPYFTILEKKTGVQRKYVAAGVIVISIVSLFVGYASQVICNLAGFIYPAYQSMKAIESTRLEDDRRWLVYWVVYSSLSIIEFFSDWLLFWIPFYFAIKAALLVWCAHPTYNGSMVLYHQFVRPVFLENEAKLDNLIQNGAATGQKLMGDVLDDVKDIGSEVIQSQDVQEKLQEGFINAAANLSKTGKQE